jgi:hypothetical protein
MAPRLWERAVADRALIAADLKISPRLSDSAVVL